MSKLIMPLEFAHWCRGLSPEIRQRLSILDLRELWEQTRPMGERMRVLEVENKRLRKALEDMPCDCTPPQFQCSRCEALKEGE